MTSLAVGFGIGSAQLPALPSPGRFTDNFFAWNDAATDGRSLTLVVNTWPSANPAGGAIARAEYRLEFDGVPQAWATLQAAPLPGGGGTYNFGASQSVPLFGLIGIQLRLVDAAGVAGPPSEWKRAVPTQAGDSGVIGDSEWTLAEATSDADTRRVSVVVTGRDHPSVDVRFTAYRTPDFANVAPGALVSAISPTFLNSELTDAGANLTWTSSGRFEPGDEGWVRLVRRRISTSEYEWASNPKSVVVSDAPAAPVSVTQSVPAGGQIAITFPFDGNGNGRTITATEYSLNGTTWTAFGASNGTAATRTITGLDSGTEYTVRVAYVNANGRGLVTTLPAITPAPTVSAPTAAGALGPFVRAVGEAITAINVAADFTGSGITYDLDPTSDPLPAGLTLSAAGSITGTPTVEVVDRIVVRGTNAGGFATSAFDLTTTARPELILSGMTGTYPDRAGTLTATKPGTVYWVAYTGTDPALTTGAGVKAAFDASAGEARGSFSISTTAATADFAGALASGAKWVYYAVADANGLLSAGVQSDTFTVAAASFPTVDGAPTVSNAGDTTAHTINLGTHATGQRLVVAVALDGSATISGVTSGWVISELPNGSNMRFAVLSKIAESGSETLAFTASVAEARTALIWRINSPGVGFEVAMATQSSANGNPPNLAPAWGSGKTLWLALLTINGAGSVTAGPAGYSGFTVETGVAGVRDSVAGAWRELEAASEDPGAFTDSAIAKVLATVAIQGAA